MRQLYVMRLERFDPLPVGVIEVSAEPSFQYLDSYLEAPGATPLSASLPLRQEPYPEPNMLPYFDGLLPEGPSRTVLAAELQLPENDYLSMLEACGKECIGDVVISEARLEHLKGSYKTIDTHRLIELFANEESVAEQNTASRLSLAGTQTKTGLAHLPEAAASEGWLQPTGYAATTHILKTSHLRDVPENEFICMKAAKECGIPTAEVALLDKVNPILAVERFDRACSSNSRAALTVSRKHQEDMAQALGVSSSSKYAELNGGTVRTIVGFLRSHSVKPARDIVNFAKMLCFSYAIGDCDAHLKNFSVIAEPGANSYAVSLSPAYDFVCTTVFERFSRDMAMGFGGKRSIDDIDQAAFEQLAHDLGISRTALANLARPIAEKMPTAISRAGSGAFGAVQESTPYIADDLLEDMAPRIEVLKAFCR